ncbi:SbcC/MukB-like Walker B domain-containing protein, partial [Paenibacillus sp. GCM10023252]|uniref:SbcC/MukB-like Walker B domain-containing protein n=1 Tax=Paenibacillus sp. GCM10023252 TaxID=3252649 RepID=UPI003607A851
DAAAAEPRLALRLDQLAQARRLEGEAAALARELAAGERRFADAAARQAHASEEAAGLQDKLSRAAARQSELKTELRSVQLQPQERQQRLSLSSRLEQHAALTSQHTAVKGELADQLMAMQHSEQRLRALSGEQLQLLKQLSESAGQLAPLHSELQNLEQAVDDVVTALPSRIQEARQAERAREHAKLAEQLAEQLGSGEPCPVCGATEHPALHRGVREEKAVDGIHPGEWQTAIPYLEEILTRLRLAKPQITSLLQRSGELKLRLEEEAAHTEAAIHSVDAASAAYTADAAYPSAHTEQRRSILLSSASPLPGAADAAHPSAHTEQRRSILLSNTSSLPGDAYAADTARLQAAAASAVQLSGRSVEGGELGAWADLAESLTRQSMEWLQRSEAESTVLLRSKLDVERRHDKIQTELELLRKQSAAAQRKLEDAEQALSAAERLWDEQFPDVDRAKADDTLEEWNRREQASDELALRLERSVSFIETTTAQLQQAQQAVYTAGLETTGLVSKLEQERATLSEKEARLGEWTGGEPAEQLYTAAEQELAALRLRLKSAQAAHEGEAQLLQQAGEARAAAEAEARAASEQAAATSSVLQQSLALSPFSQADEAAALVPLLPHMDEMAQTIKQHREADNQLQAQIRLLKDQLLGRAVTEEEWGIALHTFQDTKQWDEAALQLLARAQRDRDELHSKHARWTELEQRRIEMKTLLGRLHTLQSLFRGNAFVEFVAEEQLAGVCRAASERLSYLTRRRYALEVDSGGGFVIRDDANGGIRRPVSSLSGGETFLASLALALALSAQIQLRGRYPLQFFFLDEGFGTLDPELLDIVITALEKLQTSELSVGVISHVPELRSRLARRLVVHPAEPSGQGSRIQIETM